MSASTQGRSVTIVFQRKGVLPPVYIASTFTEPAWDPIEMHFEADKRTESAQFKFNTTFNNVHPGEHQWRFRIGPRDDRWTVDEAADMMVQEDHANNWMVVKSPKPPDTLQQWSPAPNPLPVLPEAATDRTFTHENVEPPSAIKDHAMIEPYGMQDARKLDLDDGLEKKAPELAVTAEERNKPADARPTEDATIPRTESTAHAAEDVNIDVMSSRIAVALNDDVSSDLSTDLAMAMYDQHQVVNDAPIIPSESDPSTAERPTTVAEGKKHHSTHPHPTPTETTEGNRVSHKAGIEQIHGQLHGYTKAADRSVSAKSENTACLTLAVLLAAVVILWYLSEKGKTLLTSI